MSEINLTDQRPRTTKAEMPDHLKPNKPKLPKDPVFEAEKAKFLAALARRMAERRQG